MFVSPEWLLTGKRDMLAGKEYNAERDDNVVEGDNKGVVGNETKATQAPHIKSMH
jgi:hypothetical protein